MKLKSILGVLLLGKVGFTQTSFGFGDRRFAYIVNTCN